MSELRKLWSDTKRSFEALDFKGPDGKPLVDPKKAFGTMDFGPALDNFDSAWATLKKNKESLSAAMAAEETKIKVAKALDSYRKKRVEIETALKAKKETQAKVNHILENAFHKVAQDMNSASADIDEAKRTAARNDPAKAKKEVDSALKKVAAGLAACRDSPNAETWEAQVHKPMFDLSRAIKASSRLTAKYGRLLTSLEKAPQPAEKADIVKHLNSAVVAIKAVQVDAAKEFAAT